MKQRLRGVVHRATPIGAFAKTSVMEPNFWFTRWKSGRIGFHQSAVHPQLEAHFSKLTALAKSPRVLVPLCGKSLDMVYLREQGHSVIGVELSELAAQEFFEELKVTPKVISDGALTRWTGDGIEILCGDIFDVTPEILGPVQAAYDRAAIVALPPPLRARYAEHLATLLPSGAPLLLIGFDYVQDAIDGPPFSVPKSNIEQLLSANFRITALDDIDILEQSPKFKPHVTYLREQTYLLRRR